MPPAIAGSRCRASRRKRCCWAAISIPCLTADGLTARSACSPASKCCAASPTSINGRPPVTIRLVDWADEEGARFGRSLLGSSAFAGTHSIEADRVRTDKDGIRLEDALRTVRRRDRPISRSGGAKRKTPPLISNYISSKDLCSSAWDCRWRSSWERKAWSATPSLFTGRKRIPAPLP